MRSLQAARAVFRNTRPNAKSFAAIAPASRRGLKSISKREASLSNETASHSAAHLNPASLASLRTRHGASKHVQVKPAEHVKTGPTDLRHLKAPRVTADARNVEAFDDTLGDYVTIPTIWLRDNCQSPSSVHQDTKQRDFDLFDLPQDLSIAKAVETKETIEVTWSDGHHSVYERDWLARAAIQNTMVLRQGLPPMPVLWQATDFPTADRTPSVAYEAVMSSDEGLKEWVTLIRNFGFCYVDGTPADPDSTQKLLERIAFIRETHYGGFYDFTSDLASKDTAYTSIALPAHTDNTYFSDPSGLQMFHLLSHTDGQGGASLLVDGFKAAALLKESDPEAYEILSTVPIHWHASGNDGISIQPYQSFPVLNHDAQLGHLVQVRWNESDRAAIDMPISETPAWYAAARKFDALLKDPRLTYWEQLKPGRAVVFDNWRVLHGRSEFTGKRRICGGYVNRDDFISRFKMLSYGQSEVLRNLQVSA